jgi:hypothetical protein
MGYFRKNKNAYVCEVFCFPKCPTSFICDTLWAPIGYHGKKKKKHQILHSIMALE